MSLIEAFYDESDSTSEPQNPQVLCVGGYLFDSERARALEGEWRPLLDKYGLTHFSMADCNSQWKEFAKYSDPECVVIQTAFMGVLKAHAKAGFCASIELRHRHLLPSSRQHGLDIISPYTLCCFWCVEHARYWSRKNSFDGRFAYFFEDGYGDEPEATAVMRGMFASPWVKEKYRHASDTFASKRDVVMLQTADILAWQWRKNVMERMKGNMRIRADLKSLLDIPTENIHFDAQTIFEFLSLLKRNRLRREGVT
ncbi:MAG TPA: DUF3800 domain-containing protein [Steroidobacteraceae bacterium]|nr:DUF3800 domain-containing protein [Steroidobacteraceae bacterium]